MALGLIINPGSTSTKIGLLRENKKLEIETIRHTQEELAPFKQISDQREFRVSKIENFLKQNGFSISDITGVIAIGGMMKPCAAGVYKIDEEILADLSSDTYGRHASSLGGIIAYDIAAKNGIFAYVADPVTAEEIHEVARISGHPLIIRVSRGHTLNQKAMAMRAGKELGKLYKEANFIVAHLGGGISIVAHSQGKMIDTGGGRGEGPFSMDRTGGLNSWELAKLCFSGKYTREEVQSMINDQGGVVAYLGTRNFLDVVNRKSDGDEKATLIFNALAYQVSKEIGAMATVLKGRVDAVVITGGMAHSMELVDQISSMVSFIAPIIAYPGENEMEALAEYLRQIWSDTADLKTY